MSNNFWVKIYISELDNPEFCMLSDRLYRRVIELTLFAG